MVLFELNLFDTADRGKLQQVMLLREPFLSDAKPAFLHSHQRACNSLDPFGLILARVEPAPPPPPPPKCSFIRERVISPHRQFNLQPGAQTYSVREDDRGFKPEFSSPRWFIGTCFTNWPHGGAINNWPVGGRLVRGERSPICHLGTLPMGGWSPPHKGQETAMQLY